MNYIYIYSAPSDSVTVALCLTMGTLWWGWWGFSSFTIFDIQITGRLPTNRL